MASSSTSDPLINDLMVKQKKEQDEQHRKDLEWLLSDVRGRRLFGHYLTLFGLFHDLTKETNGMMLGGLAARQRCAQEMYEDLTKTLGWKSFYQVMQQAEDEQKQRNREFNTEYERLNSKKA